jgi:phage replication-related protein YjqB (UPF0714/DUF867 family)
MTTEVGRGANASTHTSRFATLLAHPDCSEEVTLRSTFGFMAFHGGNLERMTDEIGRVAAERSGASFYAVVQQAPLREHLPSTEVQPEHSPNLDSFLSHVDVAIALHGYGRQDFWMTVLLGGRNRELAAALAGELSVTLPDFDHRHDLATIPADLAGQHVKNPVNLPRFGGVQVELPPRIRGLTPHAETMARVDGRIAWTNRLIDALVATAQSWSLR